jgi:PKD repeat protein
MHTRSSLLFFLLLSFFGWANAQSYPVSVQGTLYDVSSGYPYANKVVYLAYDSTAAFSYYATLVTDSSGIYSDTALVPGAVTSGNVTVSTHDCLGNLTVLAVHTFSPFVNTFNQTDSICYFVPPTCQANFIPAVYSPGSYSFWDQSAVTGPLNLIVAWDWQFGDGTTSILQHPSHNYTAAGNYAVCLTITTVGGCTSTFCDTLAVTSAATCTAGFTKTNVGATYNFTSAAFSPSGVWYHYWSFGDGAWSNAQNPSHTYTQNGIYQVRHEIRANDSCFAASDDTVAFNVGICDASFSAIVLGSNTALFFESSYIPAGTSYSGGVWDFGDGTIDTMSINPIHTYAFPGIYNVCFTLTTTNGCVSTFCDSVDTGPSLACTSFFNVASQGLNFNFYDSSYANTPITSYYWDLGDGNVNWFVNPTHTYAASGTYVVCLNIITLDSCRSSYCRTVTAGIPPSCQAGFFWFPSASGQYSLTVVNSSTGNNLSYLWDFGDGSTSTQAYPSHVYAGAGMYNVCLTVDDGLGCISTFCDSLVLINRLSQPFSIQVISPATSAPQPTQDAMSLKLVPNPASQEVRLSLELAKSGKGQLRMVDVQGRTVKSLTLGQLSVGLNSQTVDVSDLPDGIYLTEIMVDGQRSVQKLVVAR